VNGLSGLTAISLRAFFTLSNAGVLACFTRPERGSHIFLVLQCFNKGGKETAPAWPRGGMKPCPLLRLCGQTLFIQTIQKHYLSIQEELFKVFQARILSLLPSCRLNGYKRIFEVFFNRFVKINNF
jgi:hypothetical protein